VRFLLIIAELEAYNKCFACRGANPFIGS